VRDGSGNIYGATFAGGTYDCGTVFKLDAAGQESVLHSFSCGGADGTSPLAGLVRDGRGNLYGTTGSGGASNHGTVFKVDDAGTETVLYSFRGGADGQAPVARLVRDTVGNLYGTTASGGNHACQDGCGTVFKIHGHKKTTLYTFTGGADGGIPKADLVLDAAGRLYGTTSTGGNLDTVDCNYTGCGVVFELAPGGKEKVLYTFSGQGDGKYPLAGLTFDPSQSLYGTTSSGGFLEKGCKSRGGCGVVFKITP